MKLGVCCSYRCSMWTKICWNYYRNIPPPPKISSSVYLCLAKGWKKPCRVEHSFHFLAHSYQGCAHNKRSDLSSKKSLFAAPYKFAEFWPVSISPTFEYDTPHPHTTVPFSGMTGYPKKSQEPLSSLFPPWPADKGALGILDQPVAGINSPQSSVFQFLLIPDNDIFPSLPSPTIFYAIICDTFKIFYYFPIKIWTSNPFGKTHWLPAGSPHNLALLFHRCWCGDKEGDFSICFVHEPKIPFNGLNMVPVLVSPCSSSAFTYNSPCLQHGVGLLLQENKAKPAWKHVWNLEINSM